MSATFHRRPLPDGLIPFASADGRRLFQEALGAGTLEGWFALAEQFHTQQDPATCGLGSLVVVLNALGLDPGRPWKGPWRWFAEEHLDCCVPLDVVRQRGISLGELGCLARCNGLQADVRRADAVGVDAFRDDLRRASRSGSGPFVIAAWDRAGLGQTGSGHASPVAGLHEGEDLALVLDVARFKYPPHWVPVPRLHAAMDTVDPETGRSRGWLLLSPDPEGAPRLARLSLADGGWDPAARTLVDLRARGLPLEERVRALMELRALVPRAPLAWDPTAQALQDALRHSDAHRAARQAGADADADALALVALALGDEPVAEPLDAEVNRVRRQLDALCATGR